MEAEPQRSEPSNLHDDFFRAVCSHDEDLALDLLDRDPSIAGAVREIELPGHMREKPFSSLIAATDQDMEKLVAALLKAGADIGSQYGQHGGTALHFAAWHGHSKVVRLLIEQGAPTEIRCKEWSGTPLGWAVHGSSLHAWTDVRDQAGAARLLIEAGAGDEARSNLDGLLCMEPHEDVIKVLREVAQ